MNHGIVCVQKLKHYLGAHAFLHVSCNIHPCKQWECGAGNKICLLVHFLLCCKCILMMSLHATDTILCEWEVSQECDLLPTCTLYV